MADDMEKTRQQGGQTTGQPGQQHSGQQGQQRHQTGQTGQTGQQGGQQGQQKKGGHIEEDENESLDRQRRAS